MKSFFRPQLFSFIVLLCLSVRAENLDTAAIEKITGVKGVLNTNEGVFKITSPRNDVKISVDGWTIRRSWGWLRGRRSRNKKWMMSWSWATRFCFRTR